MRTRLHPGVAIVGVGALLGLLFAAVSTYDFVLHLDRQVHDVHCSFMPGLSGPDSGESGCQVTLVSSYSSVLRTTVWGGIPISLPAMAVFMFLLAFAVELVVTDRQRDARAAGFLVAAAALPALSSLVMAYVSLVELDAVCKLCIGIYVSSALCLGGALFALFSARTASDAVPRARVQPRRASSRPHEPAWAAATEADDEPEQPVAEPARERPALVTWGYLVAAFAVGVLFVTVPAVGYVAAAPDHERFIGTCGAMVERPADELLVSLAPRAGQPPVLEILDPLCPACRGFEDRVDASGLGGAMDRRALLFPLDDTCNWMVPGAIHPGACAVSRAMLCAGDGADEVLAWAFEHQDAIREAAAGDPEAASRLAVEAFPALAGCIDSAATKARLNRSLRWAVSNRLPVLTPQLYVGDVKLCEEDVDLGLDFALSHMLQAYRDGELRAVDVPGAPEPEPEPDPEPAPAPQAKPVEAPKPAPEPASEAAEPAPEPEPVPEPEAADPEPEPAPEAAEPEPEPEAAEPEPEPEPEPAEPEPEPEPQPEVSP